MEHIYTDESLKGAAAFWGKGSKPQQRMLDYAQANNCTCYMSTEDHGRTYYCFKDYDQFIIFHEERPNNRNWYELTDLEGDGTIC